VEKSFFRNLVAAVFAAVILCKDHTLPKVNKKYWGPLILRCVCGTMGILCNFYAIDHLLVADASILNKLSPFFAIIFSFLLLKEKISPTQAACVPEEAFFHRWKISGQTDTYIHTCKEKC